MIQIDKKILNERAKKDYMNFRKWEDNPEEDLLKKLYNEYRSHSFKHMGVNALMNRMYDLGIASQEKYDWDIIDVHNDIYKGLFHALGDVIKNCSIEKQLEVDYKNNDYNCKYNECPRYNEIGCHLEWLHDDCKMTSKINKDGMKSFYD